LPSVPDRPTCPAPARPKAGRLVAVTGLSPVTTTPAVRVRAAEGPPSRTGRPAIADNGSPTDPPLGSASADPWPGLTGSRHASHPYVSCLS
jgi:hypothetical protein